MYKVRRNTYKLHAEASKAAKAASRVVPCHLKAPNGGAWYWRERYCGRSFWSIFGA